MSDVTPPSVAQGSAGAMLRAARKARGLDLDTLAQLLKVPARKLEALEEDRHAELPGLAFVRSLALSYARQVGIDPQPVLAALPSSGVPPQRLEHVTRGLQTPYRDGGGGGFGRGGWPEWLRPAYLVPALLLLLALAFLFAPPVRSMFGSVGWPSMSGARTAEAVSEVLAPAAPASSVTAVELPASAVVIPAASAPAPVPAPSGPVIETVHSAPTPEPSASVAPAAAGTVVLRTTAESWVEVRDAGGTTLLSRTVPAGEVVGLDGAMPMRVRIGVASAVEVTLRGEPVDLKPYTRGTTATAILK